MAARERKAFRRKVLHAAAGIAACGMLTFGLAAPASAQGLFERIFSGLRQAIEGPARAPVTAFADPLERLGNAINPQQQQQLRAERGPARAFCVRTCDGHFFPVRAHAGLSAAETCRSFCPAAETRLYTGSAIDHAVANNGSRYSDLDNAFVYRKQLVAGCTCNGRNAFGLARMDVAADPTLRQGDIVATKTGLVAFTGSKDNVANFTPIDDYRGLPKTSRDKLSEVKIMPSNPGAEAVTVATPPTAADRARNDSRRRAQLSR